MSLQIKNYLVPRQKKNPACMGTRLMSSAYGRNTGQLRTGMLVGTDQLATR